VLGRAGAAATGAGACRGCDGRCWGALELLQQVLGRAGAVMAGAGACWGCDSKCWGSYPGCARCASCECAAWCAPLPWQALKGALAGVRPPPHPALPATSVGCTPVMLWQHAQAGRPARSVCMPSAHPHTCHPKVGVSATCHPKVGVSARAPTPCSPGVHRRQNHPGPVRGRAPWSGADVRGRAAAAVREGAGRAHAGE